MNSTSRITCAVIALLSFPVAWFALAQSTSPAANTVSTPLQTPVEAEVTMPLTGTLFFSQEQRQRMDRARRSGLVSVDAETTTDSQRSIINGFVKRSDGATFVWVDERGQLLASGSLADQIQPLSVGTTLSDVRVAAVDIRRRSAEIAPRRQVRPKPAAKSKTKAR